MSGSKVFEIIDLIELNKPKDALKKCQALLDKKKGNLQVFKVLKALSLERMAKVDEALVIAGEIKAQIPTDPTVLRTLQRIYDSVGKPEIAIEVFESAYQKNPDNDDCAHQLVLTYIRTLDFHKLQQMCMKIFRQKADSRFYFASIVCTYLQVPANFPESSHKLFDLCEKQLSMSAKKGEFKSLEIILLYLSIITRQKK